MSTFDEPLLLSFSHAQDEKSATMVFQVTERCWGIFRRTTCFTVSGSGSKWNYVFSGEECSGELNARLSHIWNTLM